MLTLTACHSISCNAYFFYKMGNKIINCYQVCIYVAVLVTTFFNFPWWKNMHTARTRIVVISQHDLKIKVFYVLVRNVGWLFLCIDVFQHSLKHTFRRFRDIFCNVSIISTCRGKFFNFLCLSPASR